MLDRLRTFLGCFVRRAGWLAGLALLFGLAVCLSGDLFRSSIVPAGDEASNSLRVFDAKHFSLLLGNFSRWRFSHPGPAYFYFLAVGEFLLHDLLRLTPVAFNAQIVASILMSFAFAAGALVIFRRHFRAAAFPALAALMLALVAGTVNYSLPNLVLVTIWPPGWLLMNFLFFAAAAMAVGAGDLAILPALAAGGALLAQGHASQAPFVAVVSTVVCATGFWRQRGSGTWRELARRNRTRLLVSAALVAVLALPIVAEICLHDPDNVDAIQHYVWSSRAHFNTIPQAVKFCAGFLLFTPDTERWALEPLRGQVLAALGRKWVTGFWMVVMLLAALALWRARRNKFQLSPFIGSVLLVMVLTVGVFFAWAMKVTGAFFAFNGLFIYSLHVLGLWLLCGVLTDNLPEAWNRWSAAAALAALAVFVVANAPVFRNVYADHPIVRRIVARVGETRPAGVRIVFDQDRWPIAMGVADGLVRAGIPVCVGSQWAFMFTPERICRDAYDWPALRVHGNASERRPSSLRLAEGPARVADFEPAAAAVLPVTIGMDDVGDEKEGFDESEGCWRWTRRLAHVRFRMAGPRGPSGCHVLRVEGIVRPDRPVSVLLNGILLGTITGRGKTTAEFVAGAGVVSFDAANDLTLVTPNAGPVGGDRRELGFGFISAELSAAKGCP